MMVAGGQNSTGERVLLLGLTRENIEELIKGRPIRVTNETHGRVVPDGVSVGIVYGETKADLLRILAPCMDADTDVNYGTS